MASVRPALVLLAAGLLTLMASACGDELGPTGEEEVAISEDAPAASPREFAGAADEQSGTGASPQVTGASVQRKIIQTASLTLQVEAVSEAFQEVGRIAAGASGFVASSTFSDEADEQTASITIRVPAERFQEVLASLRGLAVKVENEQSEASDVTEEYTDLQSRLRNLEATEAQYLEFLERAQDIEEVLLVQDRLNSVRADIEQVRGRANLLTGLSDMATITVHLHPEAADSDGGEANPADAAKAAWDASLATLRGLATAIVAVAVYSWWLVPIIIGIVVVGRIAGVRRMRRPKQ